MEHVRIDGIGVPVSRIVMGTDWLGSRPSFFVRGHRISSPFVDRARERDNLALLDGVFEAGCTAFDTARAYGDSERTLGAWLRSRRIREQVVIISKGGHPGVGWRSRVSPEELASDLERSLKALQTDYIDLYLIHYDDESRPLEPLIDLLNGCVVSGRIRAFGASNWSTDRIARAAAYAGRSNQRSFVASSVQLSLASWRAAPWKGARTIGGQAAESERQWYRANDLWILAYSSLAMGFFSSSRPYATGAAAPDAPQRFGDRVFLEPRNLGRLERARTMAQRLGVSPGQVALAWVLGHDRRVLPIVGARTVGSYAQSVKACDLSLSESDRMWLLNGD